MAERILGADPFENSDAIDLWHHEIKKDRIGLEVAEAFETAGAIACEIGDIAVVVEQSAANQTHDRIVVDNKNLFLHDCTEGVIDGDGSWLKTPRTE
jgi:hypothetical protein